MFCCGFFVLLSAAWLGAWSGRCTSQLTHSTQQQKQGVRMDCCGFPVGVGSLAERVERMLHIPADPLNPAAKARCAWFVVGVLCCCQ
jgi:hypothetical protein